MDADSLADEQTLHISTRLVCVYRIPPRGPTGHISGDWRVTDKIFEGRIRIVSKGEQCDVRFEDTNSGELFAVSPIPYGKRSQYVEPAIDSSRNYVLRVEDTATRNHAFLGMSFTDRTESFDFNEALLRHEKHVERERASNALGSAGGAAAAQNTFPNGASAAMVKPGQTSVAEQAVMREVQTLYNHDDYSLKEGQTMRVNIQKKAPKPGGLMSAAVPSLSLGIPLPAAAAKLAPPPQPLPPPPTAAAAAQAPNLLDL